MLVDGILQEVVSKKGLVYRVRGICAKEVTYLVTDGNGKFSHGDTLNEARESLIYKIGDRDKSKFQGMGPQTILSFGEAIGAYRVITGACEAGTRAFISSKIGEPKDRYSIGEIIELTEGQYGSQEFKQFFSK
ncbi:hypothetical protein [Tetrasphaera phage TJE1]|uniref:Uncharacterized protein n=1 Tax=Tetrasphaera phage TJE1 TaxID=981335 RepID=G4W983_9CAUD|nr:hypothetical protein G185_gp51 [Tetrasphaera phage TJE1]ADX42571.1 hypothetical protein [Tetrasphaera phage TJE1]